MSSLEELKEAFYNFDRDNDGYLSLDELRYILQHCGETLPENEVTCNMNNP